jgi:hypothetical protein
MPITKSAKQGMTTIAIGQERLRDVRAVAESQGKNIPAFVREAVDEKLARDWFWQYQVASYLVLALQRLLASEWAEKVLKGSDEKSREWIPDLKALENAIEGAAEREYESRFPADAKIIREAHEEHWHIDVRSLNKRLKHPEQHPNFDLDFEIPVVEAMLDKIGV